MGSHAKPSIARTRISQLAIGTTIAAAGVTALGAGAASAATLPGGAVAAGKITPAVNPASTTTAVLAVAKNADPTKSLEADANLAGTTINGAAPVANVKITVAWGDGKSDSIAIDTNGVLSNATPTHTYAKGGAYNVTLTINDGLGIQGSTPTPVVQSVTVGSGHPTGFVAGTPAVTFGVGTNSLTTAAVTLGATTIGRAPTTADSATLFWGDGTSTKLAIDTVAATLGNVTVPAGTTHTYAAVKQGGYNITVVLDDGLPASQPVTSAVDNVNPAAPTVTAGVKLAQTVGTMSETATFPKTDVPSLVATPAVSGTIDWGDGGAAAPVAIDSKGVITIPAHTYASGGQKTVIFKLDDGLGKGADSVSTSTQNITIAAPGAPLGDFTVSAGNTQLTGYADLSTIQFPSQPDLTKVSYTVTWDTGVTATYTNANVAAGTVTHLYGAAGTFHVSVTADDGLGHQTTFGPHDVTVTSTARPQTKVLVDAGATRYETGVIASKHHWADKGATTGAHPSAVVLATGDAFPDALAGVPFSKQVNGALLLTPTAGLDAGVSAEIQRILPTAGTTIYVLGGEKAIPAATVSTLQGLGYNVQRIAGADRFATALQIAGHMSNQTHVVVARGDDFADALAAGPYAADVFVNAPIVLTNNKTIDAATAAYVAGRFAPGNSTVAVIGGGAVTAVGTIAGSSGNYGTAVGATRYETAALVAKAFPTSAPIGVATGGKFADALTGGAYMAAVNGPLILTDTNNMQVGTASAIALVASTTSEVDVFGGPVAVSDVIVNSIVNSVHGVRGTF